MATHKAAQANQSAAALLVLSVMALLVARHLAALLSPEVAWPLADTLRAASLAVSFALCLILTPWHMLRIKCMFVALIVYYAAEVALCAPWYLFAWPDYLVAGLIQGGSFVVAAALYWFRSYHFKSDSLSPGRIYCVRTIPRRPQDFLIALCGLFGASGGYAIWANGRLYRYHRGVLTSEEIDRLPSYRYHVLGGAKSTRSIVKELDSMVGQSWTWRRNCLTVIRPIWSRNSDRGNKGCS